MNQFIDLLSWVCLHIKVHDTKNLVARDCNDNAILATFIQNQGNYLVTGDEDLLSLQDQYPVITVDAFYQELMG